MKNYYYDRIYFTTFTLSKSNQDSFIITEHLGYSFFGFFYIPIRSNQMPIVIIKPINMLPSVLIAKPYQGIWLIEHLCWVVVYPYIVVQSPYIKIQGFIEIPATVI